VIAIAMALCIAGPLPAAAARYASMVVDADTGAVLHAVNPDGQNYPASLTKMMTLYLVFEALKERRLTLGQKLPVSNRAAGQSPTKLDLKAGGTVTVDHAIRGIIVKSANDAAVVVAETLGGTEARFARDMTEKAHALGMADTTFRNASGLPHRGQLTTARDMVTLARALRRDFPQYYHYFAEPSFAYGGQVHDNHNHLLTRYDGVDGVKTGYIRASGFNIVTSAERDGRRLIGVVFGGTSPGARDQRMVDLLDEAFSGRTPVVAALAAKEPASRLPAKSGPKPPVRPRMAGPAEAAVPPRAAEPVEPSVASEWGIQVGAFQRFAAAKNSVTLAAKRDRVLRGKPTSIARGEGDDDAAELYRARIFGLTETQARKSCATLSKKYKMPCITVPPTEEGSADAR
jgi:D-alanyl-D-alanine carboxypeptidase